MRCSSRGTQASCYHHLVISTCTSCYEFDRHIVMLSPKRCRLKYTPFNASRTHALSHDWCDAPLGTQASCYHHLVISTCTSCYHLVTQVEFDRHIAMLSPIRCRVKYTPFKTTRTHAHFSRLMRCSSTDTINRHAIIILLFRDALYHAHQLSMTYHNLVSSTDTSPCYHHAIIIL